MRKKIQAGTQIKCRIINEIKKNAFNTVINNYYYCIRRYPKRFSKSLKMFNAFQI